MGNEASSEKGKGARKMKRSSQPNLSKTRITVGRTQQNGGSLKMATTGRPLADGRCFRNASREQSPNSRDSTKSPASQDFCAEGDGGSPRPHLNGNCVTRQPLQNSINGVGGLGRTHAIGSPVVVGSPGYVKKKRTSKPLHFTPNSAHLPSHFPRPNQHQLHSTPGMDFIEGKLRSQNLDGSVCGGETPITTNTPVEEYVADSPRSARAQNDTRKNSLGERSLMGVATTSHDGRKRSRSLCVQQLQADCQAVASGAKPRQGRRTSNAIMPSLARLRIQQCFKNARPTVGQNILKRACSLRSEIKAFMNCVGEERFNQLACDIYNFVTESVANIDDPDKIAMLSRTFGQKHAQLSNYGFRPEFFSLFADATIAECVRLDGGAHKRCETLLAWSQLMQYMFSAVRDGYYAEIRQQRRSSLPQHKLLMKQGSTEMRNTSFDMDL